MPEDARVQHETDFERTRRRSEALALSVQVRAPEDDADQIVMRAGLFYDWIVDGSRPA